MMKKYLMDILCIAIFGLSIPLLVVEKPEISYSTLISNARTAEPEKKKDMTETITRVEKQRVRQYKHIEERNIFSPDGVYRIVKGEAPPPENPYRFIGVLRGKDKRAVFMDYTGEIITLKPGEKLGDGSVIRDIDILSVKLKKGKKETELRIFNLDREKK
ncbi:MAG: hypothetical protein QMC83_02730 [Thermodesulfovibrionales bacterium]|nr:hypothetical protein [Thermodesulfovibrionales bacterium]